MMHYILVVDDDQFANTLVDFVLSKEGYEVATTDNPRGAIQMVRRREPDLMIVDVMMPHINGFEFAHILLEEGFQTPVIFITAQDGIESKLQGFHVGGDDYICKPFNHEELVARVQAVLRRLKRGGEMTAPNSSIHAGNMELLPRECRVIIQGTSITLTPTETQVLRILMTHPGRVIDRDLILSEVWNDIEGSSNMVDVYIRRLRMKIEANPDSPAHIITVRGMGYKFIGEGKKYGQKYA